MKTLCTTDPWKDIKKNCCQTCNSCHYDSTKFRITDQLIFPKKNSCSDLLRTKYLKYPSPFSLWGCWWRTQGTSSPPIPELMECRPILQLMAMSVNYLNVTEVLKQCSIKVVLLTVVNVALFDYTPSLPPHQTHKTTKEEKTPPQQTHKADLSTKGTHHIRCNFRAGLTTNYGKKKPQQKRHNCK